MDAIQIDFYTREGCHLCTQALAVLRRLESRFALNIRMVDISGSAELMARYGKDIPVAVAGGREIFRHRVDEKRLGRVLDELRGSGSG